MVVDARLPLAITQSQIHEMMLWSSPCLGRVVSILIRPAQICQGSACGASVPSDQQLIGESQHLGQKRGNLAECLEIAAPKRKFGRHKASDHCQQLADRVNHGIG